MFLDYAHLATATIVLFSMALLMGKAKAVSDYVLIGWLAVFLINVAGFWLLKAHTTSLQGWSSGLLQLSDAVVFLHGPLYGLYILALIRPALRLKPSFLYHLLPFGTVLLLMITGTYYARSIYVPLMEALLKLGILLAYIVFATRQLGSYRNKVNDLFSNVEKKSLSWLYVLSTSMVVLWVVFLLVITMSIVETNGLLHYDGTSLTVPTDLFVLVLCYFGVQQPAPFGQDSSTIARFRQPPIADLAINETATTGFSKYKKSGLTPAQAAHLYQRLQLLMERKKPYLTESINLLSLAAMLDIPPNHLSQTINACTGMNFFDFINQYRIEEVKRILISNRLPHLTLLGIAFECGFSSKAAFNRAFKKFAGVTPTEFKHTVVNA